MNGLWRGFQIITRRRNTITGEWIDIEPLPLHHEDVDWWVASWAAEDEMGYKMRFAGLSSLGGMP